MTHCTESLTVVFPTQTLQYEFNPAQNPLFLWKEGIFYFEDVDLETILDDMARWYNVNVFYMNPALKEMKFSVEIRRYGDINEILRRIEQTKRVKFEIKDRTINVYE